MSDRMIQCPDCFGESINWPRGFGCHCGKTGTIPDRRAPSAAEDALRAEVEKWKAEAVERGKDIVFYSELHDSAVDEVARLQAELEKYTAPLTEEQAEHLVSYHDNTAANWRYLDGEIRAAREGAGK